MNERIKELAEQASFLNKDEESIEYFAQLIVRECARLVETREPRDQPIAHIYLLKEFGIKQ